MPALPTGRKVATFDLGAVFGAMDASSVGNVYPAFVEKEAAGGHLEGACGSLGWVGASGPGLRGIGGMGRPLTWLACLWASHLLAHLLAHLWAPHLSLLHLWAPLVMVKPPVSSCCMCMASRWAEGRVGWALRRRPSIRHRLSLFRKTWDPDGRGLSRGEGASLVHSRAGQCQSVPGAPHPNLPSNSKYPLAPWLGVQALQRVGTGGTLTPQKDMRFLLLRCWFQKRAEGPHPNQTERRLASGKPPGLRSAEDTWEPCHWQSWAWAGRRLPLAPRPASQRLCPRRPSLKGQPGGGGLQTPAPPAGVRPTRHSRQAGLLERLPLPPLPGGRGGCPWIEEPGRLQSMGSLRVRHN